jgi:hypothetical protein
LIPGTADQPSRSVPELVYAAPYGRDLIDRPPIFNMTRAAGKARHPLTEFFALFIQPP